MKKKTIIWISLAVLLAALAVTALIVCLNAQSKTFENKVVSSLPKYETAVIYENTGEEALVKYGKYTYKSVDDGILSKNEYLKKLDAHSLNIEELDSLMSAAMKFDLVLGTLYDKDPDAVAELTENFDIDIGAFCAPNYFFVETVTGDKTDASPSPDTCDKLYIYYFDIEAQTLYYMYADCKS